MYRTYSYIALYRLVRPVISRALLRFFSIDRIRSSLGKLDNRGTIQCKCSQDFTCQ